MSDVSSDAVICVLLVSLFVAVVFVSLLHPDIANIHNNATKMIPLDFIVSHLSLSDYFLLPFSFHIISSIQQCYTIILACPPPGKQLKKSLHFLYVINYQSYLLFLLSFSNHNTKSHLQELFVYKYR